MWKTASMIFFALVLLTAVPVFALDSDKDGLQDEDEHVYYTDPNNPDTDGDGFSDGVEVEMGFSPHIGGNKQMHESDFDNDGLNDWLERWFQSDMGKSDTDGDGTSDFADVMRGQSPTFLSTSTVFIRRIVVDLTTQQLSYLVDGVKIKTFPVSTGNPRTPTLPGEFTILRMVPMARYIGADYDLPNVPWNMEFLPSYFIHAAYWHNDFGKRTHSHGCVNMRTEDAKLLYQYMEVGIPVTVTGTTPARMYVGR